MILIGNGISLFINTKNIEHNLLQIKNYSNTRVCAVVKANAYGHGMVKTAAALSSYCDMFAVSRISEAKQLRKKIEDKPILILADFSCNNLKYIVENNIELSVCSLNQLEKLNTKLKKLSSQHKLKIHIKVNSGMNRLGINKLSELNYMIEIVKNNNCIKLCGIYTHMCYCDDLDYTERQFKEFMKFVDVCKKFDKDIIAHCAASDAICLNKKYHLDMVRPGIALYGGCTKGHLCGLKFLPAMTVCSNVIFTGYVKKGEKVGYNCNYTANYDMQYAVIGTGYADGFKRINSNTSSVMINDKLYKIIGNVCMDLFIIEADENIKQNDTVILMSDCKIEEISYRNVSQNCQTIIYEIFTSFTRADRHYIN